MNVKLLSPSFDLRKAWNCLAIAFLLSCPAALSHPWFGGPATAAALQWRASWIAPHPDGVADTGEPLPIFRKSFNISKRVEHAMLYGSGLGQDELRLNGSKVGTDELTPGWTDYRKTIAYDSYDVTALLHPGENALGVMLGNGMYRVLETPGRYTKFLGSMGQPKCIVQLHIEYSGGGSSDVLSDSTWKTLPGPITFSSTYGGEDFDARREPQGWDRPGFSDAHWSAASIVSGPGGTLVPELAPAIRVMRTYAPVKITHPKPGVSVYDLGQNFAGWPSISVSGPAGTQVKLIPGELLDAQGIVTQRSSGGPQWFSYSLRGAGLEKWHPRFTYYGFRYVQVESGIPALSSQGVQIHRLSGEAVHTSSPVVGSFTSSDDLLNRIHMLIVRAIENNSMSLFTDCPHREKLGWLEETHLMAPSLLYDFDFTGLYAATARNIRDTQRTDGPKAGMVPEIAPQYVVFNPSTNEVFNDSPEWGSAAVLAPWYVYQRNGNRRFLAAQYDVMRRYTSYLGRRAHDGIIDYGLGDWYDIGPGEPGLSKLTSAGVTATAIYYQDLTVMERVSNLLNKAAESKFYHEQMQMERNAFNFRFFDTAHHRYDKGSQTAQAMPLVVGLVPEQERAEVLNALVEDIRAHQNHVTAGDIGFHYVVDALLDAGRCDVMLDMLERTDSPSYGYQLAKDATALTEMWDADPDSSQDHFMLGHAEEWFYRGLTGINVDMSRERDERLILRPAVLGRVQWARARYQSTLGMIESGWRQDGHAIEYSFNIPAGATATIELSTPSPGTVTVNAVPLAKAGISAHIAGHRIQFIVKSGNYEVRAASPTNDSQGRSRLRPLRRDNHGSDRAEVLSRSCLLKDMRRVKPGGPIENLPSVTATGPWLALRRGYRNADYLG